MKRIIEHTTDAGTHLKLYVVFVPYINKWVVDCEVHRKEKNTCYQKVCPVYSTHKMFASESEKEAIRYGRDYLYGYAMYAD